jgi:hypothetical protein
MFYTGKQIHKAICKLIPDFDDADLYNEVVPFQLTGDLENIVKHSIYYNGKFCSNCSFCLDNYW